MRFFLILLASMFGVATAGCGDGGSGSGGDHGGGGHGTGVDDGGGSNGTGGVYDDGTYLDEDGVCRGGTLSDYCRGTCPSYEQALAAATEAEEVVLACDRDGIVQRWSSGLGTCGDLRWVMARFVLDEAVQYFDAQGNMISVEFSTDCDCFCGRASFTRYYGPVQTCRRVTTTETCDPSLTLLGRSPLGCGEPERAALYVDENFDLGDWEIEARITGNGTEADYAHTRERVEAGGDPGAYLSMVTRIDTARCTEAPCGYEIEALYRRRDWVYDPQEDGAILKIHYSQSTRVADSEPAETLTAPVFFQENAGGEVVRHDWQFPGRPLDTSDWLPRGDCSANLGYFTDPPPDYEGGPISFGIVRRTRLDEPGLIVDTQHDLDSFRVTVIPQFRP